MKTPVFHERTALALAALASACLGCASAGEAPRSAGRAPGETRAPVASATATGSPGLAFADSPRVLAALPPDAQAVLLEADAFDVLMIAWERGPAPDEQSFQGYPVVKRVPLAEREARRRLLSLVNQGIHEGRSVAFCFEPHHGISARKGDRQVDLVVCFACLQLQAHGRGVKVDGAIISRAAEPEFRRLLGPIVDRPFGGRTIEEWRARFGELAEKAGDAGPVALEPADRAGIVAVAESMLWGGFGVEAGASALRSLGRQAAPACPVLVRVLGKRDDPYAWKEGLAVIEAIGPAAGEIVPAVVGVLTRDLAAVRRARPADSSDDDSDGKLSEQEVDDVRIAAINALGAIGPGARTALPELRRLATAKTETGKAAAEAIKTIAR